MKIAVSSDSPNLSARVAQRFGISPYLIIVDPETMEIEVIPNPGAAGRHAVGVQAVVTAISKAEMAALGKKFALIRNALSLVLCMVISLLTLFTVSGSLAVGYLVNTLVKD